MRKAFEDSIAVLGESAKQVMMYELTIHAEINFADGSLTVAGLHESLVQLYGKDTADVIIEQVVLKTGLAFRQLETRHD